MLEQAQKLSLEIKKNIPLAEDLAFSFVSYDGSFLESIAPFEKNKNDKNTAFAGSIATLAVLTGWSLVTLKVQERFPNNSVAAVHTEMSYKKPIVGDIKARVWFQDEDLLEPFLQRIEEKGSAKILVNVELFQEGHDQAACYFEASYWAGVNS